MNTVPRIKPAAAQPAAVGRIDPREWETRVDLAACYRLVDLFGMCDLHLNHISARVPGQEEHFLINPFGMMYEEITASSLIKIELKGNIIANSNPDYSINLPGYVIHSAIHAARPDVACVLHTHTNAGMAVSSLKCGLLPLACNAEISVPPQDVIARSNAQLAMSPTPDAQGRRRPQGSMEWPALKRMLDR